MFKDYTLQNQIQHYKTIFNDNVSIKFREFQNLENNIRACIIFSEGMIIQDSLSRTIIRPFQVFRGPLSEKGNDLLVDICAHVLSTEDVYIASDDEKNIKGIFSGDTLLLVDGCKKTILITTKGWETRGIQEPKGERVTQGSQEGFTEAALINTTLIKRRIPNSALKFKHYEVGKITKTDIYLSYVEGIVSPNLIQEAERRIREIQIDAIIDSNYISECISDNSLSGFDTVGTSERPDIIAAKLLEGKLAILCNGSPNVLYAPHLFYEMMLCNEDYYYNYLYALFNRIIRLLAFIITSSISPIYLALVTFHQQILPKEVFMTIAVAKDGVPFKTFVELIVMIVTFEILREAGTRLSLNIGQAVSIVGAIVLGEAAVSARLISAPIVIITALSGITSLMLPKLMQPLIYIRFFLLLLSGFFGLYGYIFGVMIIVSYMMTLESFGINYISYISHISKTNTQDVFIRLPWSYKKNVVKNVTKSKD